MSFNSLAQGLVEDEKLFRRSLSKRKRRRDELTRLKSQLERKRELHASLFTKKNLDGLSKTIQSKLNELRDPLRKAYIQHLVDSVIVGEEEIRIQGSNEAILAAACEADLIFRGEVPSSDRGWRRERDSNPRYGYPYTDLANQRLQPLGHLSAMGFITAPPLPSKGANRPRGRIHPGPLGLRPAPPVRR